MEYLYSRDAYDTCCVGDSSLDCGIVVTVDVKSIANQCWLYKSTDI